MVHLFYIAYRYSGVATYSRQLLPYLRKKADVVVYEVHLESECCELEAEKMGTDTASGIGWRICLPKINLHPATGVNSKLAVVPMRQVLWRWLEPIRAETVIFHCNSEECVPHLESLSKEEWISIVSTVHFLPKHYTWKELDGHREVLTESATHCYKRFLEMSDRLICVTEFAAKSIAESDGVRREKITVIYNGYTPDLTPSMAPKRMYGKGKDDITVLYVGRISPEKGVYSLVRAFREVGRRHKNIKLLMVGDGETCEVEKILGNEKDGIDLLGSRTPEEINDLYAAADMGVIPSKYEQCSYVALEMMANGLPVVATCTPGLNELFSDGVNALLVDLERGYDTKGLLDIAIDESMLERQLERLAIDTELRSMLSCNGTKIWRERFMADVMGEKTYILYKSLER